jgi:hypothetical protein
MGNLVKELIIDMNATFRANPLLWWVGILEQSALQTDRDDYISRGRFGLNILTMDMDVEERLEALLHYSLFVLQYSIETWQASAARKMEACQACEPLILTGSMPTTTSGLRSVLTCVHVCYVEGHRKHVQAQSKKFLRGGAQHNRQAATGAFTGKVGGRGLHVAAGKVKLDRLN